MNMKDLNIKELYKIALTLAILIMVQNLISTLVNTADSIMLGYMGQSAMAAASLANQYTFVLFCVFFGMVTGTSVLASQYYGKGDYNTIERVMGLAVRFSVVIAVIFTILFVWQD